MSTIPPPSDSSEVKKFDVFLSHNSSDKVPVEQIARHLKENAGLNPFLDKWHLIPGEPWQEVLEEAINQSRTCAVFLGSHGLGAWENEEMRMALERRVKQPGFRVIPVLLPGSTIPNRGKLPRFLARLTWVDLRNKWDDPYGLQCLIAGIKGLAPGPGSDDNAPNYTHPPYKGLDKFYPEDSEWFFGRESEVQHLIEFLKTNNFLAVLGASGSGKSSVVLGGLVPAIQKGAISGSEKWQIIILTPTDQPLEELASHLVDIVPRRDAISILNELESDQRSLHLLFRLTLAHLGINKHILLVIDQFEEIFTLCQNDKVRERFIGNILYAAGVGHVQVSVIITIRADFLAKCANYSNLADRIAAFQFIVTPMETHQLRKAIEEPAAKAGLTFEPGLIDVILKDIASEPGGLPLLEYALLELWKGREGRKVTYEAYRVIGGVTGALTQTADETMRLLDDGQRMIAKRILLDLIQPGEGTEDTRRRTRKQDLVNEPEEANTVDTVLQKLANRRLITTTYERDTGDVIINLAHEALIKNWQTFQGWIKEQRESIQIHRRLMETIDEWKRLDRDTSVLYRGTKLTKLHEWADTIKYKFTPTELAFLDACRNENKKELSLRLEQQTQLEAIADGILATDAGQVVTRFNASAEKIFGLSRDIVIGNNIENIVGLMGAASYEWIDTIRNWTKDPTSKLTDDASYTYNRQIEFEDTRVISVYLSPLIQGNDFLGTISVFHDITHQVTVDRLKSEFIGTISHELQTPMTSIKGYIEILLTSAVGQLNKKQTDFLEIMRTNTERLSILVNDLLDVSRIEDERVRFFLQSLDARQLAREAMGDLERRNREEAKGMDLQLQLPPNLPHVLGDTERIHQIFDNLLDNAYYYTPAGGRIEVSMAQFGDEVQIEVQDNGIGIPLEDQPRIFERFFRGKDPLVQAISGTGLGLAIVRHLVEMHNGRIWFKSSGILGEGSVFTFTLPVIHSLKEAN